MLEVKMEMESVGRKKKRWLQKADGQMDCSSTRKQRPLLSQHEAVGRRSLSVCCDAVDDETQGILILPGCDINTGKLQPQRRYNTSPLTSLSHTHLSLVPSPSLSLFLPSIDTYTANSLDVHKQVSHVHHVSGYIFINTASHGDNWH